MNLHSTSRNELEMILPLYLNSYTLPCLLLLKNCPLSSNHAQECLWALQHFVVRKGGEKIGKESGEGVSSEVGRINMIVHTLRNTVKKEFI